MLLIYSIIIIRAGACLLTYTMIIRFPPKNAGTLYGISNIPIAILNGGYKVWLGYHLIYNFTTSSESPSVEDIQLRSLTESDFKLTTILNFA